MENSILDNIIRNLRLFSEDTRVLIRTVFLLNRPLMFQSIIEKNNEVETLNNVYIAAKEEATIYHRFASILISNFFGPTSKNIVNLDHLINTIVSYNKRNNLETDAELLDYKKNRKSYFDIIKDCKNVRDFRGAHFIGEQILSENISNNPTLYDLRKITIFIANTVEKIVMSFRLDVASNGFINMIDFKDQEQEDLKNINEEYAVLKSIL